MFKLESLKNAVVTLHGSGASDYFKTYLTLKVFGLKYNKTVMVDTSNTQPAVSKLFLVRKLKDITGYEDTPFYDPLTNQALKEHAARSIFS